ncbi:MAG: hypothetical protein ACFCD0_18070 [Gemmataceae bacterium]
MAPNSVTFKTYQPIILESPDGHFERELVLLQFSTHLMQVLGTFQPDTDQRDKDYAQDDKPTDDRDVQQKRHNKEHDGPYIPIAHGQGLNQYLNAQNQC